MGEYRHAHAAQNWPHADLKNLALTVSGEIDAHFTALWDRGRITFFPIPSLPTLLTEAGIFDIRFRRVGRLPRFVKSMMAAALRF